MAISIGMLEFVDIKVSVLGRLALLGLTSAYLLSIMLDGNKTYAICIFVTYISLNSFYTAIRVWCSKESMFLLKTAAFFLFCLGLHWLDYPFMVDVEWFVCEEVLH